MKKLIKFLRTRAPALLLALVCMVGMIPAPALAAGDTIKLDSLGFSGVRYQSSALGSCELHQMRFNDGGQTKTGFCGKKGGGMGASLIGQSWTKGSEITDPTVKMMVAYYYAHATNTYPDIAKSMGVNETWSADYTWYYNAWVQAIIWRYQEGTLNDPVEDCAEELMHVLNSLRGWNKQSIDDDYDGASFRARTQYIMDLGKQGCWGDSKVYLYNFSGKGSSQHPAGSVQSIVLGDLIVDTPLDYYSLTVKKTDATNPNKGISGARFRVQSENGSYSKDIVTGNDGTYTLKNLSAGTYAITETEAPDGYQIDDAGPQYATLPKDDSDTVTVTFTDTPEITGKGSIRKVDADDPTKGLAGATIKITGVDNPFTGTYVTGMGGYLTDVPWDTMPHGSYTAEEVAPPAGYSLSPDAGKVKQSFTWDGKTDVALVFENDAKVKVKLIKQDASGDPLEGVVFNIIKDGQVIGTEATDASGEIIVPNVTEGLYAFAEAAAPAGKARLEHPAFVYVDQSTVEGGGTVTVTAVDKDLPDLTILKRDAQTKAVIPGTVFEVRGVRYGYHQDVTTGEDGTAVLNDLPVDSYEVTEKSVPDPYVISDEPTQTVWLGGGDSRQLIFDNLKKPELTVKKVDAVSGQPIPGTVFTVEAIDGDYKDDWTTGEDGTVSKRVAPGSYKITEKSVPAPYYLPSKVVDREQTISLNAGDEKTLVFKDYKAPELTIYKEDSVAGAPVEGARFHVTYTSNGESEDAPESVDFGEILTDANGEIRLHERGKRLYPGEYTVTEVAPAPGFQMKEPTTQKVILHGGESKTLTFENVPLNAIIVQKNDSVTHEVVPGCTFQLRYLGGTSGTGGTVIGQKTTGKNGTCIWTGLKAGTYIVEEVDPADGYNIIQSSETVYLADNGEQSVITVRFENAPDGSLLIRKVCSVNPSVTLQDAEFKITYADGTLIGDSNGIYRTDENGEIRIDGLKPGKSVIVTEVRAPAGFIIDTQSQTIQVKAGKTVTLTFKNQPKGGIIVQKRDSDTGQPLPGAEFRITTAAGCEVGLDGVIGTSTLTQNGIFTTDAQGEIRISNLAPGTYVLTEIKAPDGYVMDSASTNVVIGANGDTQTVVVKNSKKGNLIVHKLDSVTKKPLEGVQFRITYADGRYVDAGGGKLSSNGLYWTDENGQIVLDGITGTLVVTEVQTIPGYTIHEETRSQTVVVNPNDTQELYFYNDPIGGVEIVKVSAADRTKRIANVTFEIRRMDDGLVGTVTTDKNGRAFLALEDGAYYAVEIDAPKEYRVDSTPIYFNVVGGKTVTKTVANEPFSGIILHKTDSVTGKGIYGVKFVLYDSTKKPIGEYETDQDGYIYIDDVVPKGSSARFYLRELEAAEGYKLDKQYKTVYIKAGETIEIEWENTPITAQIQIWKKSADDNPINGFPAGTPLEGAVFEIYDKANRRVDTIKSDSRGLAVSKQLPLGRYTVKEVSSPANYSVNSETVTVYLEHEGQIVQIEMLNKSIYTNVSVQKRGYTEVVPGQSIRYTFSEIANNSTVPLDNFYWRDTLPTDAVRLDKIITGTWSSLLNYKVVFKTNLNGNYRVIADNLNTQRNYTLDASAAALGLASNEYVTEVTFLFGRVPAGFRQVQTPYIYCNVLSTLTHEYRFTNKTDVGGTWQNQWIMANDRWVTIVYRGGPTPTLPRTGY